MAWTIHSSNYDSTTEKAAIYLISATASGEHMSIHINVPNEGDLRESEIQALIRAKATEALEAAIAALQA